MVFCRENNIKIIYLIMIRATTCADKATRRHIIEPSKIHDYYIYSYKKVNTYILADVFRINYISTTHTYWVFMMHIPI